MGKRKQVLVDLVDRFKLVLYNQDRHMGHSYVEDEWNITLYAPTIKYLIDQATIEMVQRLIKVDGWDLDKCQVLIYNGNIYEIKDSAKDIKKEYSTLVDDIISTNSYKEAYTTARKVEDARILEIQKRYYNLT